MIDPTLETIGMNVIRKAAQANQWDMQPFLAVVAHPTGQKPGAIPIQIPEYVWKDAHPANVMDSIAKVVEVHNNFRIAHPTPGFTTIRDMVGLLLVFEAHTLHGSELTTQERADLTEWSKTNRLEHHPSGKAREIRLAMMIDRSHTIGHIEHIRGEDPGTDVVYNGIGVITEAVRRFMTTLENNPSCITCH